MTKNVSSYRVIYGDTDQMGVVYYANYLRWFEMGRTELLRQIGAPYTAVEKRGLFFPVTEVSCRYLRSARFDDEIAVETILQALGRATLVFGYKILRQNDGVLLVEGWTRHACLDGAGKLVKITPELNAILQNALAD
ncbi:MAG TPA: thioesterase family protein [Verrucomicrobiae bacterium]|jgi:acyl-CoA thioester hydrolase|nr:thioesterase family protein [Verrucomicrobiae bacterium]